MFYAFCIHILCSYIIKNCCINVHIVMPKSLVLMNSSLWQPFGMYMANHSELIAIHCIFSNADLMKPNKLHSEKFVLLIWKYPDVHNGV